VCFQIIASIAVTRLVLAVVCDVFICMLFLPMLHIRDAVGSHHTCVPVICSESGAALILYQTSTLLTLHQCQFDFKLIYMTYAQTIVEPLSAVFTGLLHPL